MQDVEMQCSKCHQIVAVEEATWKQAEEEMRARQYDTLVLLPSGDLAMDQRILSKTHSSQPAMAQQSLLFPPLQENDFEQWLTLISEGTFDYCLHWGHTSDFAKENLKRTSALTKVDPALGPTLESISSCHILAAQEVDLVSLNSHFLNKVFYLLRKLTQLSARSRQRGGEGGNRLMPSAVWNLDAVQLTKPASVFMELDSKIYIKASFG